MNKTTPLKAIRKKCLDCSCDSKLEVKECPIPECPIYLYRFGKNPARAGIGNIKPLLPKNPPHNEGFNDQKGGG
jgi:hypothetical protein